ncbi:MAG: type II secretion system protein [Okeania sp. SIO3B5]|uniref:pilus assembly FimT family protein n=1 Tax=Okeania sp. SIO3B5 TaxID=2607811 RepID=UPI0013FFAA7E|nr:type II secretion system protein [Okeania sp. SIO3B5]NEO56045.1 type II secretion system protein [Okeania sp. SIO3B5]
MKNLVLFKLIKHLFSSQIEVDKKLPHSSIFPTTKTKVLAQTQKDSGFTMLELIIVVLVIGILSAIAAPAWNAFIDRQRIRTVNDDVLRVLQKAQLEAKRRKDDVKIEFLSVDPPRVDIEGIEQSLNPTGDIKAGMIELVVLECQPDGKDDDGNCTDYEPDTDNSITFDFTGAVDDEDTPQEIPFVVTVSRPNGQRRCVFVQTLLGGMRTDEGEFTSGKGCPESD